MRPVGTRGERVSRGADPLRVIDIRTPIPTRSSGPSAPTRTQGLRPPVEGLVQYGRNELAKAPPEPWWRRLARQFTDLLLRVASGGDDAG